MSRRRARAAIVRWGASLFARGLTGGSSGNISVRLEDGYLVTPTNSCLGFLQAARLSWLDAAAVHVSGDEPTKEWRLHLAFYENRPAVRAVVHLHSSFATALSCLAEVDPANAVPPLTPYVAMRVGKVAKTAYARPGSPEIAASVAHLAAHHSAILLQNHGPVVAGVSLESAIFAIEELEEACKLTLLTRGMPVRPLEADALADLGRHFALE